MTGKCPADLPALVRHLDWNLLRTFADIVDCGGISAAARALHRQQPSISAALRRLEDHVGTTLCLRSAKGVELTPAGTALLVICHDLRRQVGQIPLALAKADGLVEGQVVVRLVSGLVSPVLDRALARFHRDYPNVELRLEVAPWRSVLRGLLEGEADLGLTCDSAPTLDLDYVPLMRETQQLYCGPDHERAGQQANHPAELRDLGFVLTGQDEPDELAHFRRRYGLGARMAGRAETLGEARRLIELGVGIGFLPIGLGGALSPLLPEALLPSYDIYVVARPDRVRTAPASLLLQTLRSAMVEGAAP